MSTLVTNVPPTKVWVSKNALRDYTDQLGEWTLGFLVSVKSIPGRALYWEVYLPEYGAMYDKLTIDALRAWGKEKPKAGSENELPIEDLQFWNCFDFGIVCIEKNLLHNMEWTVKTRSGKELKGKYLFTLDNYHPPSLGADLNFSEVPDEHKSHNVLELEESGHIVAFPNNRCRITDPSLSYNTLKAPDFKVATRYVDVEYAPAWGRLGEQDDYHWETPQEKDAFEHCQQAQDICERDTEFVKEEWMKDLKAGKDNGIYHNVFASKPKPIMDRHWDNREPPRTMKEVQENPYWEGA